MLANIRLNARKPLPVSREFKVTSSKTLRKKTAKRSKPTQAQPTNMLMENIRTFPPHLRDEIVTPPKEASSARASGVDLIFEVYQSHDIPKDHADDWHDSLLGTAIRLFDTCLAFPASKYLTPHKSSPLLAAACLLAASKCVSTEIMEPIKIVSAVQNNEDFEDFSVEELIATEEAVLQAVQWDLLRSCDSAVVNFIHHMLDEDRELTKIQTYALKTALELVYTEREFCCFLPSVVAASVLAVTERYVFDKEFTTLPWKQPSFECGTFRSQFHHEQCAQLLQKAHLRVMASAESLSPQQMLR